VTILLSAIEFFGFSLRVPHRLSRALTQRPYRPVNVAFAKVWKCRSNPTSAADAALFLASGSLSTSTAKTVIW
jgi:hypothetical protein